VVKPEIVANLVDRLMEGVPKAMVPALEAAAIVRWFDQPILRAVMAQEDVRDAYNELRRFPFVRTRAEGLVVYDAVREILDERLRMQDSERHRELHQRAAEYFERRLEKASGEERWKLGLELLFHRVCADEEAGTRLCEELAEELVRYRRIFLLRTLLNDAHSYPLEQERSRLWQEYFRLRLEHLETQALNLNWAQKIMDDKVVEPVLRGSADDLVEYDVFISHAWEDKPFARDLAEALRKRRLKVWYDEFTLSVGDKLRRSIDRGLANSRFGIVILSTHFFEKEWPQKELDGLVSRETLGTKIILPIWHNITVEQVRRYSPMLADRVAVTSNKGMEQVVAELLRAMLGKGW